MNRQVLTITLLLVCIALVKANTIKITVKDGTEYTTMWVNDNDSVGDVGMEYCEMIDAIADCDDYLRVTDNDGQDLDLSKSLKDAKVKEGHTIKIFAEPY